jgi:hypothetical protein
MAERKVIQKYFPPDFDPNLVPRTKKKKRTSKEIRFMLPITVRCTACGEFMYMGKKFNARKEDCPGDDYLGIKRFRLVFRCCVCPNIIALKTDPQHCDYEVDYGATRNYERWQTVAEAKEKEKIKNAASEALEADSMHQLERRAAESKRERADIDALDDLKAMNQRKELIDPSTVLRRVQSKTVGAHGKPGVAAEIEAKAERQQVMEDEDDNALLRSIVFARQGASRIGPTIIRRLDEDRMEAGTVARPCLEANENVTGLKSSVHLLQKCAGTSLVVRKRSDRKESYRNVKSGEHSSAARGVKRRRCSHTDGWAPLATTDAQAGDAVGL